MITHDYKLIFIHIPKCAGRSICDIFNQRFDHYTAYFYSKEYSRFWNEYKKFAIIRNPYERLVSMYHYIQQHRRHKHEPIGCNGSSFKKWVEINFIFNKDFDYSSPEAERGNDWSIGSPFWFSSQKRFLSDNNDNLFDSIKLFKLDSGMHPVLDFLKSNGVEIENIKTINDSRHDEFMSYYDYNLFDLVTSKKFIQEDLILIKNV